MPSYTALLLPLLASSASAFMAPGMNQPLIATPSRASSSSALPMVMDYNDPAVMEEFNLIQTMEYDEVVDELAQSGVRAPIDMNEMDVKLMLVEFRTMMKGGGGSAKEETPPTSFENQWQEYMWTKPLYKELYERIQASGDHNKVNVMIEYANDGDDAVSRYFDAYPELFAEIDAVLIAKKEVTSPTVRFSGFPANMGEAGLKMTLEAVGEIADMTCSASEDGVSLGGEVTFGSIDTAKAVIDQYDGMDMGMGDVLKMDPL